MTISATILGWTMAALATPSVQQLGGDTVVARVQAHLQARLDAEGSTARLQPASRIADLALPEGEVSFDVGRVAGRWPRAAAGVPVRIAVDGRTVRRLTVWMNASDPRAVLGYAQDFAVGTVAPQAVPATVDMVCCTGTPVASEGELRGMRLRRDAHAGAPVLREDLEPTPAISARQTVSMAVQRGAIRIVTPATALQDGALGQRIAVRPAQSRHAVQARIVAAGEVVVDE